MSTARDSDQRRKFYRIVYPEHDRPFFVFSKKRHAVLDISEGGMRLIWGKGDLPIETQQLNGIVQFNGRGYIDIVGTVLRVQKGVVIVEFVEGVPLEKVMAEQRYLINRYGRL